MRGRIAEVVHGCLLGAHAHSSIVIPSGSQSGCDGTFRREEIISWHGKVVSLGQIIPVCAYHAAKNNCYTMIEGMAISLRITFDNMPTTREEKKKREQSHSHIMSIPIKIPKKCKKVVRRRLH